MPAGPGVGLAEGGGGAPAAGPRPAAEQQGETGRESQADPGRGGEAGGHHEGCCREEGENNTSVCQDNTLSIPNVNVQLL